MYIKDGASEADLYCSNPPKGIKMVEIDKLEFSAKLLGIKESRRMLVLDHEKLNMHWRKIEVGRTSTFGGRVTSDRVDRVVVIDGRRLDHFSIFFQDKKLNLSIWCT